MGRYVKEDKIYYWVTDSGKKIPVDMEVPSTPMRRDFFRPFIVQAMKKASSKIKEGNPLTERAKEWKKSQGIKSITKDELIEKAKKGEVFIDQKIDGQTALMKYLNGKARFGSLGGRVHTNLPVLDEIESVLEKKGIDKAIIVGELAGYENGKVLHFRETQSLIKDPEGDRVDKLHWFPYDIISLDGEKVSKDYDQFVSSRKKLDNLFKDAKHIHPTKYYIGGESKVKEAWNKIVEQQGNEGVVVRTPQGDIFKARPEFTYDLVILAVGDKKLKAWPKKEAGNILVAFMDKDRVFRVSGEVGTGWTREQRKELYDWAHKNKVSEDDHYVWVKPKRVVEVEWQRSNVMKNKAYEYSGGDYKEVGKKLSGTVVKPVFVRYREDKDVSPENLRLEQVPNWEDRKEEKLEKKAAIDPLNLNEFMQKHTLIMIANPDPDNFVPPQRMYWLWEEYKKMLKKNDPEALAYHKDMPPLGGLTKYIPVTNNPRKMQKAIRIAQRAMSRTAGYPDNPKEVVISKSENILEDQQAITELDVWSYYQGVKFDLIDRLEGNNLFVVIKTDDKTIYKRHPYDKDTEFIRINNEEQFSKYHSGRTVEYHITADETVPFYAVDIDPPGYTQDDFSRVKKAAKEVSEEMKKIDGVDRVEIHYTGKRGFHVFGYLGYRRDVSEARDFMKNWLKDNFGEDNNYTLSESPGNKKIALGLAPLKENGGHIARWSMRVSGLCCVPVKLNKLLDFSREESTPEKVHKDLTGKELKRIEKTAMRMSARIASSFLRGQSDVL